MAKILIVEDDPQIRQLLQAYIEKYGYEVVTAHDFDDVLQLFRAVRPSLVLMDVNLPRYDGFYWCKRIRLESVCPILFISAREGTMDQVMALESGADDYITKPFHYELVMAKIRSLLRRAFGAYAHPVGEQTLELEGLLLYPESLKLSRYEKNVDLSKKETVLIQILMSRPEQVISREYLTERLWDDQQFVDENTLNVNMTRVRKKLKLLGIDSAIETIRGAGYRLQVSWREEE